MTAHTKPNRDTPKKVFLQRRSFTWVCDGKKRDVSGRHKALLIEIHNDGHNFHGRRRGLEVSFFCIFLFESARKAT